MKYKLLPVFLVLILSGANFGDASERQTTTYKLSDLPTSSLKVTFASPFSSINDLKIVVDRDPTIEVVELLSSRPDNTKLSIIVSQPCIGICSRLLLPIADEVSFEENGFAALTDSTARTAIEGEAVIYFEGVKNGKPEFELGEIKDIYQLQALADLPQEIEIMVKSGKNYTHLSYRTQLRQILMHTLPRKCTPIKGLAIILDESYLKENRINVIKADTLSEKTKVEALKKLIEKPTILKGYQSEILFTYRNPETPEACSANY